MTARRAKAAIDLALLALASVLAASLLVAGWSNVSQGYDIWYYHLPFAARLTGIMNASTYAFSLDNEARYAGFPLFAEFLQGLIWRITGHIESTSFVSLGALFGLVIFLRRMFAVPLHLAFLALFAIPLVHIHATSSYVDLPANACATMLLLCVYKALQSPPTPRFLVGCAALAAATANMKFQLVPIVGIAATALLVLALRDRASKELLKKRLVVFLVALPIVFATPIKNAVKHGNPVWPVEIAVLGHAFPHVEAAYSQSPIHLRSSSRPTRFVHSVLELDNHPIAEWRWSLDQWAPNDDPACRMGGYFGAYVIVNLVALGFAAWRKRTRETKLAAALFGGVTVVASLVPQSHELRYYMHWMLLLVALNLIMWTTNKVALSRPIAGLVALAALGVVVWSTNGGYLYSSGSTFAEYLAKRADVSIVQNASPGERLCIAREPFTFLYAPAFHPNAQYVVQEAVRDADCRGARKVP